MLVWSSMEVALEGKVEGEMMETPRGVVDCW